MDVVMRKLDRCLQKLFRFLPAGTLSVVVLLGHARWETPQRLCLILPSSHTFLNHFPPVFPPPSTNGHLPGLCLMEVKQDCWGDGAVGSRMPEPVSPGSNEICSVKWNLKALGFTETCSTSGIAFLVLCNGASFFLWPWNNQSCKLRFAFSVWI